VPSCGINFPDSKYCTEDFETPIAEASLS
jgi:hypothetical protein